MKLLAMFVVSLLVALAAVPALAQQSPQSTFRDAGGRTTGTATTDSQGTTVFRDAGGRTVGTASRSSSSGTTTYRDAGGRTTGTTSTPRR
jgi:hypothetical protein